MEFTIEVEIARGWLLVHDLFGGIGPEQETVLSGPGGTVLELKEMIERKALDFPSLVTFVLSIPTEVVTDVATGLVASWLYDKLSAKGRPHILRIDRTEVHFEKGEITKFLSEHIESRRD